MKKIALLLLCLMIMLTLAGCVAANPYNSFQSSVIGGETQEPQALPTDAPSPLPMQTTQTETVPEQTAQPDASPAQPDASPAQDTTTAGYNG